LSLTKSAKERRVLIYLVLILELRELIELSVFFDELPDCSEGLDSD
jgi:hypothetical protein